MALTYLIVQNDVNHGLPSDNSNTSHTHLTRFYSRPSTIAPYFSLLLKANTHRHKRKQEQRNFQVSLLNRPCFDSSRQLLLTGCVWLVTTASLFISYWSLFISYWSLFISYLIPIYFLYMYHNFLYYFIILFLFCYYHHWLTCYEMYLY